MEESAEVLGEERHERRAVSQSIVGSAGVSCFWKGWEEDGVFRPIEPLCSLLSPFAINMPHPSPACLCWLQHVVHSWIPPVSS